MDDIETKWKSATMDRVREVNFSVQVIWVEKIFPAVEEIIDSPNEYCYSSTVDPRLSEFIGIRLFTDMQNIRTCEN